MLIWKPTTDRDHLIECDSKTGQPIRVIKGNKTLKEIINRNLDNPKRTDLKPSDITKLKKKYKTE